MVSYCCVEGCNNNSSNKNKYSKTHTFHAFPSNTKLRSKWLKAIGRPSWEPPSHARVCSVHFNDDQINREHQRTRLRDDACPVLELPEKMFELPAIEVCQICLVIDVKMFNLMQTEVLKICFKSVIGLAKTIEDLPQFVCFECASQLMKSYRLVEKSQVARKTLLAVLAKHGQITKRQLKKINRTKLNLASSLTYNEIVPKTLIDLQYDEDLQKYTNSSVTREVVCKEEENVLELKTNETNSSDFDISFDDYYMDSDIKKDCDSEGESDFGGDKGDFGGDKDVFGGDKGDFGGDTVDFGVDKGDCVSDKGEGGLEGNVEEDLADDLPLAVTMKIKKSDSFVEEKKEKPKQRKSKRKSSPKNPEGLTQEEVELQEHFNIVIQTLQEQIEERLRMKESAAYRDGLYKCEICYKTYLHPDAYKVHMDHHDPSRGAAACSVCQVRYGSAARAAQHAAQAHARRLYCRRCPKVFSNVRLAKSHLRRHEGFVYKCDHCDFSSLHESALLAHSRNAHGARYKCNQCDQAFTTQRGLKLHARKHSNVEQPELSADMFICKLCDIRFAAEEAWRVHMLTSAQHKDTLGDSAENSVARTCSRCGEVFASVRELQAHVNAVHMKPKKMTWKMPGDSYPTQCEHCGAAVRSRQEHYAHVRRAHPQERQHYRPVVTAVCDTCGKGFQNSTKLHLHELRHGGAGTVRCPHCPRLFYDKYQLARHAGVHSDARPHACRLCDKAFKLRSNLDRHAKVHSGAAPYECSLCGKHFRYSSSRNLHVRAVHLRLPQPPRRRPARRAAVEDAAASGNR